MKILNAEKYSQQIKRIKQIKKSSLVIGHYSLSENMKNTFVIASEAKQSLLLIINYRDCRKAFSLSQ
ncbi:MAG: hypothetical protein H8E87_06830 [FCB group bacterium]|nr:hypothetical protein [FCB group bacterium]